MIEWRVSIDNQVAVRVTEPDFVIEPSAYWQEFSNKKVEKVKRRKVFQNRWVRLDDTSIVASVLNNHSQHNLHQQSKSADIVWIVIEKQLLLF